MRLPGGDPVEDRPMLSLAMPGFYHSDFSALAWAVPW